MKTLTRAVFLGLSLSFPSLVHAQDLDRNKDEVEISAIDLGGTVLLRQSYIGSDQTEVNVLPYIGLDNVYGFDLLGNTLKYELFDIGTGRGLGKWSLRAGPRAAADFGRDSDDSPTLEGLDDIDLSVLAGGFVRATLGPVGLDISAGQDFVGGHGGFVTDFTLGTRYPGDGWYLQPAVTITWADENFTQETYGITAEQALASTAGLAEFNTSSGFHQVSGTLLGGFELTKKWNVTGVVSYRESLGNFRDSPIITAEDGATGGFFGSLSLSRRFGL